MKRKVEKIVYTCSAFWRFVDSYIKYYKPAVVSGYCKYFLLAMLQCVLCCVSAQQPYSLIHYDENVLPQTSIGNIAQDANGYLWMSTQFGIVRFDGEKFRVFTTANLKGLTSNRIRLCAKGVDKAIYFVDENNVIVKVISPNQFEIVALSDAIKESKPLYTSESNNDFAFLQFDKKAGYKQLANSLQLDPGRELLKSYAISTNEGYIFYLDLQQKIRICYYKGRHYTSRVQNELFQPQHTFKLNNRIFIQLSSTKAQVLKEADQKLTINVTGLPADFTRNFTEKEIVLFSNESGVFFYSSGKLYQYQFRDSSLVATLIFENLPCVGVVNVMKERTTGDFLISTKSTGVYRIKTKQFGVVNLTDASQTAPQANSSMNSNIVYALALWDSNHIFSTGFVTPVALPGVSRNFDPGNNARFNYFFLFPKDDDHIWLNMNDGIKSVIQSFNKRTGTYNQLIKIVEPKTAIELSSGAVVIVASRQIVSLQNNIVKILFKSDTLDFTTAEKLNDDCLVIGTSRGPCYFYPAQGRLEMVPSKANLRVRYIFKDRSWRLWFTTYGQGLFFLSGNAIIPIPMDNAGHLAIGHSISEDHSGNFWISTNHGLFKIVYTSLLSIISGQNNKLYYTYFDKTDGFNTNEFNGGCFPSTVYQKKTGLLFLPSMDGIVKFHPDSIKSVNSSSAVIFDEIVHNDTARISNVTNNLVFPKRTSTLQVHFSSPYYGHVENVKFSYTLSNAPGQWIELKGNRSITLSNLPGGSYKLVVKKEDATNVPIFASLSFEIRKKFSETVVFKLMLLALVVGLVYLYFRARLLYLSNERKRLEKEVAARTADQLSLIDQLKNNIAQLQQLQLEMKQMIGHKENIIAVLIHDIKSPLYFLNTVAAHLDKNIELAESVKNKKIANEISISLNRLYIFTQDFATWLEASRPGYLQKKKIVDLEQIIDDAVVIYKGIIEKKNIVIRQTLSCRFAFGDEPMIKSVVRNLIDNAIKNTLSANLTITTECLLTESACEIIIADEGKGMEAKDVAALNNYFQYPGAEEDFSTTGFGHKVIRDFLLKLGGSVHYSHNSPSGIIVNLKLPVVTGSKA